MERFVSLPKELVHHVLSYSKHFKIRKGILFNIIPYDDPRRAALTTIPKVDRYGHSMLADTAKYELHLRVVVFPSHVRWTFYKYFKNIDEEEVMDGVVFSMQR
jgi:hypothetical protein